MIRLVAAIAACFTLVACGGESSTEPDTDARPDDVASVHVASEEVGPNATPMGELVGLDSMGEAFVKLALAVGQHDPAFVDAYHGPEEWSAAAKANAVPLDTLEENAQALLISVSRANADAPSLRGAMLEKLTRAALARRQMTQGVVFSFNDETRLLYDAVAPEYDIAEFDSAIAGIESLLPGEGPLNERVDTFRKSLAIPEDKLQLVFDAAIAECRRRTLSKYDLPDTERFSLEFVTDKPWSGYNWYQGDYDSLIQVNMDLPIIIDRAVDLGCHEGYPGHHTWNIMLERELLKGEEWIEYSVYPLFSPLSITAEGSANFGIELAFPGDEKTTFERDVLFPLAELDPADAEKLNVLNMERRKLSHARNHIAREYLDGRLSSEDAVEMLMRYNLVSRERAEQSLSFIDTYRGYVINYNIGRDIVGQYIQRKVDSGQNRWDAFQTLLMTPLSASDIEAAQ